MVEPKVDEYRERVAAAYKAAGVLKLLAWIVVGVSLIFAVATTYELMIGKITMPAAVAALAGTVLAGILSGGTAYASAVSVGLGAARLEHGVAQEHRSRDSAEAERPADLDL